MCQVNPWNEVVKTNLKAKNAEYDDTGKDRRPAVNQGDQDGITVTVIMHRVVTWHGNKSSKGNT